MTRLNIRMTHHDNGTTTISGIPTSEVCSLFIAASLEQHNREDDVQSGKIADPWSIRWVKRQRRILNMIDLILSPPWSSGYDNVPVHTLKKHELAVRRRDVINARHERLHLDRVMKELFSGVKSS